MKHISLITCLLLLTTHSSQAMNSQKKYTKPSRATKSCLEGIESQNSAQVKQALLAGADVNYTNNNGESLFYIACKKEKNENNKNIVTQLITHKNIDITDRSQLGATPLFVACEWGLHTAVKSMLQKNPQAADMCNIRGNIPLLIASSNGHKNCVELLLTHDNKNINWQNYRGSIALHAACEMKQFDCIKLLIENGADTAIKNNFQLTPLSLLFSQTDDIQFDSFLTNEPLIASKLIHSTDNEYNNQLHLCTKLESINLDFINYDKFEKYLLFLISREVGINARNNKGKRPVDLAYDRYITLYNFYIVDKSPHIQKALDKQEAVMHAFLRVTPAISCALSMHILQQKSGDDIQLPKDIATYIALLYYTLNIETIIAKKYKHNKEYYDYFIENKQKIKRNLLTQRKTQLLWSAS